jgi:transposase-like protein
MEPPKKRKYTGPEEEDRLLVKEEAVAPVLVEEGYGEQHAVVSSEGGGGPAKRNRRSYSLEFKVAVLDSYYNDPETRMNQRKTAIKFGVNRRQIQKWLAQEETLRGSVGAGYTQSHSLGRVPGQGGPAPATALLVKETDPTSPLSTYLNYQPKIDYLRRGGVAPLTVLKEEASDEEEELDYVIDEGPEDTDEDGPINLSKSCSEKRSEPIGHQVRGSTVAGRRRAFQKTVHPGGGSGGPPSARAAC